MSHFPENLTDRFRRFRSRHYEAIADHYDHLATHGQSPDTMIVSCCDSRVDPETIFSAMPGELFIMRNIANLVPPYETGGRFHGVSAALEYAALNLCVKHIVIMGHSGCGGVKASVDQSAAVQTEAHFISNWISMLDGARLKVMSSHQGTAQSDLLRKLEFEAVKTSIENMRTFPFIKDLEAKGRLLLHGAHFDIKTGTLSVLNHVTGEFFAL
jgi:carbonic anhydrase